MNLLKKFMRNDNADLEEENYDDLYVMPDDLNMNDMDMNNDASAFDAPAAKAPEARPVASEKVSLKLLQPKSHIEATSIADRLKEGSIVLLDISNLKKEHAIRLVDFLAGVAYVLGGEMIKTNKHTIVVSPAGVDISSFAPEQAPAAEADASAEDEDVEYEEYEEAASDEN